MSYNAATSASEKQRTTQESSALTRARLYHAREGPSLPQTEHRPFTHPPSRSIFTRAHRAGKRIFDQSASNR